MRCFIPGCSAAVTSRCKTFGDGCARHLDRWARSSFRVISRGKDADRTATAKAQFVRLMLDEMRTDREVAVAAKRAEEALDPKEKS